MDTADFSPSEEVILNFKHKIYIQLQLIKYYMKKQIIEMDYEEHKRYHRKLLYVAIIILLLLFAGTIFYHYVENWRCIDALYFSAATMTTVGYGDITPQTDFGKLFTIFYVFTGVGVALYGLSLIASHFAEVREVFWMEMLGKMKIKHTTLWEKLKNSLNYKSEEVVRGHEKSFKIKK